MSEQAVRQIRRLTLEKCMDGICVNLNRLCVAGVASDSVESVRKKNGVVHKVNGECRVIKRDDV